VTDPGAGGLSQHSHGAIVPGLRQRGAEIHQIADGSHAFEPAIGLNRDAGGVIPAVLELPEPVEEHVAHGPLTDISDDSTHSFPFRELKRTVGAARTASLVRVRAPSCSSAAGRASREAAGLAWRTPAHG
jgi:hypothetical protein